MHCGTNNRAPRWTFTDPYKPEARPDAREESASPVWLAAPAMKNPYRQKNKKSNGQHKHVTNTSITQRLRTDLGRQKGGDLTQSYDKSPYTNRNVKGQSDNTNKVTKKFD